MNAKLGTPFIYFAIVSPLVVTGVIALVPHTGTPFNIGSQLATIIIVFILLDFTIILEILNSLLGQITIWPDWLNPILITCHLCILAGGVALNRGKSRLGARLVASACAVIIMFVALGYFVALAMQESHRWDLPDDSDWMVTFGLIAPIFYLISVLVALFRATYLRGANRPPTESR